MSQIHATSFEYQSPQRFKQGTCTALDQITSLSSSLSDERAASVTSDETTVEKFLHQHHTSNNPSIESHSTVESQEELQLPIPNAGDNLEGNVLISPVECRSSLVPPSSCVNDRNATDGTVFDMFDNFLASLPASNIHDDFQQFDDAEDEECHSSSTIAPGHALRSGNQSPQVQTQLESQQQQEAVYNLRAGVRTAKQVLSTWPDQDESGDYDPIMEGRDSKPSRNTLKRTKSALHEIETYEDSDSLQQHNDKSLRMGISRNRQDYISTLKFTSIAAKEVLQVLDCEHKGQQEAHMCHGVFHGNPDEPFQNREDKAHIELTDKYTRPRFTEKQVVYEHLRNHPAARGCRYCYQLGLSCSLLQPGARYPCETCVDVEVDCELLIPARIKQDCERCREKGVPCSYSERGQVDFDQPCAQCQQSRKKCIAAPAQDPARVRIGKDGRPATIPSRPRRLTVCAPCGSAHIFRSEENKLEWSPSCNQCTDDQEICMFESIPYMPQEEKLQIHEETRPNDSRDLGSFSKGARITQEDGLRQASATALENNLKDASVEQDTFLEPLNQDARCELEPREQEFQIQDPSCQMQQADRLHLYGLLNTVAGEKSAFREEFERCIVAEPMQQDGYVQLAFSWPPQPSPVVSDSVPSARTKKKIETLQKQYAKGCERQIPWISSEERRLEYMDKYDALVAAEEAEIAEKARRAAEKQRLKLAAAEAKAAAAAEKDRQKKRRVFCPSHRNHHMQSHPRLRTSLDNEEVNAGQVKGILTRFCHPITFSLVPNNRDQPCRWCEDPMHGMLGYGERWVRVFERKSEGYCVELGFGHGVNGKSPDRMCRECTLQRALICACAGHSMVKILWPEGSQTDVMGCINALETASAFEPQARKEEANRRFCSLCLNLAEFECHTANMLNGPKASTHADARGIGSAFATDQANLTTRKDDGGTTLMHKSSTDSTHTALSPASKMCSETNAGVNDAGSNDGDNETDTVSVRVPMAVTAVEHNEVHRHGMGCGLRLCRSCNTFLFKIYHGNLSCMLSKCPFDMRKDLWPRGARADAWMLMRQSYLLVQLLHFAP